jgi:hypothetical protein
MVSPNESNEQRRRRLLDEFDQLAAFDFPLFPVCASKVPIGQWTLRCTCGGMREVGVNSGKRIVQFSGVIGRLQLDHATHELAGAVDLAMNHARGYHCCFPWTHGDALLADREGDCALEDSENLRTAGVRVLNDRSARIGSPAVSDHCAIGFHAGDRVLDVFAGNRIERGPLLGH